MNALLGEPACGFLQHRLVYFYTSTMIKAQKPCTLVFGPCIWSGFQTLRKHRESLKFGAFVGSWHKCSIQGLGFRVGGPSLVKPTPPDCQFLVGNGGIDPYSSPYIIPDNSLQNLFPHSLQSTRQQRLLEVGPWLLDFDTAWAILRTRGRVPGFGLGPSRATIYCCFLVLLSSCVIHAIQ